MQQQHQCAPTTVSRSLSVPMRNVVIVRSISFTNHKGNGETVSSDGTSYTQHVISPCYFPLDLGFSIKLKFILLSNKNLSGAMFASVTYTVYLFYYRSVKYTS